MLIVTSGISYIDIDAYASIVAYAELLNLMGAPAVATSSTDCNESVTSALRALNTPFMPSYMPKADDQFIVVDVSDPAHFDEMVDPEKVVEIFDHHPGFEKLWSDKLGEKSHIEFIGAAATQIYEMWQRAGLQHMLSQASTQLLAAAILDNTLNFGAQITTDRDRDAYGFLANHGALYERWVAQYFTDCQSSSVGDLVGSLLNDTKHFYRESLGKS